MNTYFMDMEIHQQLLLYLMDKQLPPTQASRRKIKRMSRNFIVKDKRLFYTGPSKQYLRLVILPTEKQNILIESHHNSRTGNHFGARSTRDKAIASYYWPTMIDDINEWIKSCQRCKDNCAIKPVLNHIKLSGQSAARCAAFGCKTGFKNGSRMFSFPKDQEHLTKWKEHSDEDQLTAEKSGGKLRLKPDVAPTPLSHRPKRKKKKLAFVMVPPIQTEEDHTYCTKSNSESELSPEPEQDGEQRPLENTLDWCHCGSCHQMPNEVENVCCRDIPMVLRRIQQVPEELTCITNHPGFEANCLNHYVLQNISNIYKSCCGPVPTKTHIGFTFVAYRSFVSWCWGSLAVELQVVIPSCAVRRIKEEFPDLTGHCVGFIPSLD
ncbi:uncharacterized protein LOC144213874 [Stigmatopora nigra]